MLIDTRNYSTQVMQAIGELGAVSPETLAGFESLDGAAALVYSARAFDAFGQQEK